MSLEKDPLVFSKRDRQILEATHHRHPIATHFEPQLMSEVDPARGLNSDIAMDWDD